jgi:hypothetical protein
MTTRLDPDAQHAANGPEKHLALQPQPADADDGDTPPALRSGNEHPLIDIPFTAIVDGRSYRGEALSLVEAHVSGLPDPALRNRERLVQLSFQFQGFNVALNLVAWIERLSERTLVLSFTEPTGEHLPQLRYLINEYLAGDLTSLGSVIRAGTLGGPAGGKAGTPRRSVAAGLRSLVGSLAALGLTLALLGTAAVLVERRLLVSDLESPGQVIRAGETLRAIADGQVVYLEPSAREGEVAFAIASTRGETLSVGMPCDCDVRALSVAEGSTVLAGEPILRLSEPGAPTLIEARVTASELFDLQRAGSIEVLLADGTTHAATLSAEPPRPAGFDGPAVVTVRLLPSAPIPDGLLGQPVALRAHTDAGSLLEPVADALGDLGTRAEAALRVLRVQALRARTFAAETFASLTSPSD